MAAVLERPSLPGTPHSDRYEFQKRIGIGGMGSVYRALDRETGRVVAIKVLHETCTENPMLHKRLVREFRAASELEHPNIVLALDLQQDGEVSYVVFELVEGTSLGSRIIAEKRIAEAEAIRIVTQVGQALDYAHKRKVVHRDVKPDNILLRPDGRAKLTDFGLVKDYGDETADELTRQACGMGTPNYMAPEQFVSAKTAGVLCDVYSLAATLYTALTGTVPFAAKTPAAILNKKLKGDYQPVRSIVTGVDGRVDEAIAAGLDPDPARRPESCLAFFKLLTTRPKATAATGGRLRTSAQPLAARPPAKQSNRRTCLRFPVQVGTCGIVDADGLTDEPGETWPLVIRDVSTKGVGILLARRFEIGSVLTVEFDFGADAAPQPRQLKVVRVIPERDGHWAHGCTFSTPLSPVEVQNLLKVT